MYMEMQPQQQPSILAVPLLWLRNLIYNTHFYATEAQSGVLAVVFGSVLLMPWDTFGSALGYRAMAQLAPEWAWGAYFALLGLTQLHSVIADWYRLRRWTLFLLTLSWFFVAFMLAWASLYTNGPYTYAVIACSSAWAYWRLALRG